MDFKTVLGIIIKRFKEENIDYALMGGFALGALGIPRATVDLDFLIFKEDLSKVDKILKENNYKCIYKSEEVSQYVSPIKLFGEIDFLLAHRKISRQMLERANMLDIFGGEQKVRVLKPEDIIGLKLQSVANNPQRTNREYSDIESLLEYYGKNLDWQLLNEYFSLFEEEEKFREFKRRFLK